MPGMMAYENIQIQLIDTPPLSEQPPEWWLMNIIRRADALLIVVDLSNDPLSQLEAVISKLQEKKIALWESQPGSEEEPPVTVQKALVVCHKKDLDIGAENFGIIREIYGDRLTLIAVSASAGDLEELRLAIFRLLDVIRVYTKVPGGKPDMRDPIILERGGTLEDAAVAVHKDFGKKLKYARIWGSGKFDGVMVKRDHVLQDGDIIELHT
jgi:ribosome-interacting GTPase 1